jgi:hypothetical protein
MAKIKLQLHSGRLKGGKSIAGKSKLEDFFGDRKVFARRRSQSFWRNLKFNWNHMASSMLLHVLMTVFVALSPTSTFKIQH